MIQTKTRITIKAPLNRVFEVYSDAYEAVRVVPELLRIEKRVGAPDIIAEGDQYICLYRVSLIDWKIETTLVEYDRNKRLVIETVDKLFHGTYVMDFRQLGENTEIDLKVDSQIRHPFLKPFELFYCGTIAKVAKKQYAGINRDIAEEEPQSVSINSATVWSIPAGVVRIILWSLIFCGSFAFFRLRN